MVEDITGTLTTAMVIITPFILLGINWYNTKQNKIKEEKRKEYEIEKAEKLKQDDEKKARDLKEMTEKIAADVKGRVEATKESTLQSAVELKRATEKIAEELKQSTANILMTSKTYTESTNKEIIARIGIIDNRVMTMLSDLRKRAELTNGNVATLRTDIADLQEQIEELFEDKGKSEDEIRDLKKEREKKKRQRQRRKEIDADRIAQSERNLNPSASGESSGWTNTIAGS